MKKITLVLALVLIVPFIAGFSIIPGCDGFAKDGGIYKSSDMGEGFEEINRFGEKKSLSTYNVSVLKMDQSSPNIIYAGTTRKGLFKTEDSGEVWRNMLSGVSVSAVAIDPKDSNRIYVSGVAGSNSRIFINSEGGEGPWEEIFLQTDSKEEIVAIQIDVNNENIVYAISAEGHLYKSLDKGSTWSYLSSVEAAVSKMILNKHKTNELFAATKGGLYVSSDYGANWKKTELASNSIINSVVVDPNSPQVIYAVAKDAIYKSTNSGVSFDRINTLIKPGSVEFWDLAVDPSNSSKIYFSAGSSVHRTSDGGVSWAAKLIPSTRSVKNIVVDNIDGSNIYVGLSK